MNLLFKTIGMTAKGNRMNAGTSRQPFQLHCRSRSDAQVAAKSLILFTLFLSSFANCQSPTVDVSYFEDAFKANRGKFSVGEIASAIRISQSNVVPNGIRNMELHVRTKYSGDKVRISVTGLPKNSATEYLVKDDTVTSFFSDARIASKTPGRDLPSFTLDPLGIMQCSRETDLFSLLKRSGTEILEVEKSTNKISISFRARPRESIDQRIKFLVDFEPSVAHMPTRFEMFGPDDALCVRVSCAYQERDGTYFPSKWKKETFWGKQIAHVESGEIESVKFDIGDMELVLPAGTYIMDGR